MTTDTPTTTDFDEEDERELVYTVRIRTYGHKHEQAHCGKVLAKVCALNFREARVFDDQDIYSWSPDLHDGGLVDETP